MKGKLENWKIGKLRWDLIPSFHSSILPFTVVYCLLSISSSAQFTILPNVTNVTCSDGNDGSASVSVSGGTSPYTYQWLPGGQTTQTVTGLVAGDYSVAITDNAGNDSTVSISVTQPLPIADNDTIRSSICTDNGYILLDPSGGTTPYQFLWNTGQVIASITQLSAGTYSVIITDANNCTAEFSYPLTEIECEVIPEPYFTPNGDDINDSWYITNSRYFENARVIVFDRWGTKVYEHKGLYEPWDGKSYLGIPVPDAAYYFFFYKDKNDKQKNAKSGSVTILR